MEILHAVLQTNKLDETKQFYSQTLGCTVDEETATSFRVKLGKSALTFRTERNSDAPYYHFALDIPPNQFLAAKQWAKERVALLTENGADEIEFTSIVAKSIYFEDPSGNIVEFIARQHDNRASDAPFSAASIRQISEMSFVVLEKIAVAKQLATYGIVERDNGDISPDGLTFMNDGKSSVYILVVSPNRRWLFSQKVSQVFPVEMTLGSGGVLGVNDEGAFYMSEQAK